MNNRNITEREKVGNDAPLPASVLESSDDRIRADRDRFMEDLQLQVESMPIACVLADQNNRFIYWNPEAERAFGYLSKEMEGKRLEETILPPSGLSRVEAGQERLQKDNRTIQGEISEYHRKDGKTILCEWYVTPLRDVKGNSLGSMGMAVDITERRKVERVQSQLAAIMQQTTDAVIGSDLEGRIFSWNRGAEVMLGYRSEEVEGEFITRLVPHGRGEEMENIRSRALKDENVSNYETVLLKRDGSLVDVSVAVSPVKDFHGKIVGVSVISRDITAQKRAQESSKKNEEKMRLSQKMEAVGSLAGGVAHDFNNLLSVIEGNSDFLKAFFSQGDPHLDEVEEIQKAVQRGAELTKQLLAFGKKQVSQPQLINLNGVGTEMSKMFKRLIDASIDFALIQDEDLKLIRSDPGQIQQVILNLVINARDAMPKGGHLIVVTKNFESAEITAMSGLTVPPGRYVGLSVTDTGTGIDEETQKRLFEPFFTTKGEKGTGIGLATVYGIVQQWNGHIWLHSTLGVGTTFSICFPATREEAVVGVKPKPMSLATQGSETILVAEDEEPVRKIVVRAMENCGYRVLQAGNGFEAIQQAWKYKDTIHLLLTDTVMPKMNGKELAEALTKARPKMSVLFMSGYPREVLSKQGSIDPSLHLIQKPFSNTELAERVRALLDQKAET